MRSLVRFVCGGSLGVLMLAGCGGSGESSDVGVSNDAFTENENAAPADDQDAENLFKVAKHQAWADLGALKERGHLAKSILASGVDEGGRRGYHAFTFDFAKDAAASFSVTTTSFQPFLVVKVRDCSACTSFAVGKKTSTGFEIKNLQPKKGTIEGPIRGDLGDLNQAHAEIFITSVENLRLGGGQAVSEGDYTIKFDNLE